MQEKLRGVTARLGLRFASFSNSVITIHLSFINCFILTPCFIHSIHFNLLSYSFSFWNFLPSLLLCCLFIPLPQKNLGNYYQISQSFNLMASYEQQGGKPLPKFGEWDVNDPASAEGFTVIFNKARDEKKTGGGGSGRVSSRKFGSTRKDGDDKPPKRKWFCFKP